MLTGTWSMNLKKRLFFFRSLCKGLGPEWHYPSDAVGDWLVYDFVKLILCERFSVQLERH